MFPTYIIYPCSMLKDKHPYIVALIFNFLGIQIDWRHCDKILLVIMNFFS